MRSGVKIWPHKEVEPGSTVNESVIWAGEWRRGLFSSYGMGGLINVELTPEFCARLGAAFAATLPRNATIAVARDHARSSRMIKRAMVSGLISAGATVRDLNELPVPITQFATRGGHCDAGVHVLVSPLDQRSADIRFFDGEGCRSTSAPSASSRTSSSARTSAAPPSTRWATSSTSTPAATTAATS